MEKGDGKGNEGMKGLLNELSLLAIGTESQGDAERQCSTFSIHTLRVRELKYL